MTCGSIFDVARLRQQLSEVEKKIAEPTFWSNSELSQQTMRERKRLEESLATDAELERRTGDIAAYFDLAKEGESVEADLRREMDALKGVVETLETKTLLSGENDARNAIVTPGKMTRAMLS
jgi:peptide chain release factor 2